MASKTTKVRFVYCPKCRKLLTEFSYIPFYKCGGCGTILKAKYCMNGAENGTSKTVEESVIQKDEAGHDSEDNDSISSSKQASICSTDAYLSDMDSGESRVHDTDLKTKRNLNASALTSADHSGSCRKKESSESGETGEAYAGKSSDFRSSWANGQPTYRGRSSIDAAHVQPNYNMWSKPSHDQCEISEWLLQCSSEHLRSSQEEMEESTGFSDLNPAYEEGMSDIKFLYTSENHAKPQTAQSTNSHSLSSSTAGCEIYGHCRRPPLSKRTLHVPQSAEGSVGNKGMQMKDDIFPNDNVSSDSGMQSQEGKPVAMSLKDNNSPQIMESVYPEPCKSSQTNRYDHQAQERGKMLDPEVFQAVQKWMDAQMDRPQQFPLGHQGHRRNPLNAHQDELISNDGYQDFSCEPNSSAPRQLKDHDLNQKELLRKLENLIHQLSRSCNLRGSEKVNKQAVCYDNSPQQDHLQVYDAWNPPGMFGPRKTISQQWGTTKPTSSECATNCRHHVGYSCLKCFHNDQHFSTQFHSKSCPSQGLYMSSAAPILYQPCNLGPACSQGHMDHNKVKHHEGKNQQLKRHCRPIAGAAPFVVCYRCFKLLQLPADFLLSRGKRHRLRCGACSEVLIFSLRNNTRIFPCPTQVTSPISEINTDINVVARNTTSISEADGFHHGDMISYSDDYPFSIPKSYSTDCEPATAAPSFPLPHENLVDTEYASRISLEQAEERMKQLSEKSGIKSEKELSNSLGPSSDGARPDETFFEGNSTPQVTGSPLHQLMGYSSPGEMLYGQGNGIKASEELDLEIPTDSLSSDYHMETSEEDETLKRTYNKSNSSLPFHAQSNHRLENMKVSVNGRVIPDHLVKRAEEKAGPIQPGNYWYDSRAGFWGAMGQACLGIITPFIEEFNYPLRKDCAGGNTSILVNGRELHQKDLKLLSNRGLPTRKNRAYAVDFGGQVIDEETRELYNLGKLAPTVEKLGCGFGMRIPLQASSNG